MPLSVILVKTFDAHDFYLLLLSHNRHEFQNIPMHGQFLLAQLETPDEAVLGRITAFLSEGKLASGYGEEFNLRALRENRQIPDDLREDYLKYRVNIRVLGVLRKGEDSTLQFVASHRRLPHVDSPVAFPSGEVLREIVGHHNDGAIIGHFALGEYIYAQDNSIQSKNNGLAKEAWMQLRSPEIPIRFPVKSLVSRRSFIFARAGSGKLNLNKLLFSTLYKETPTVPKRIDGEDETMRRMNLDPFPLSPIASGLSPVHDEVGTYLTNDFTVTCIVFRCRVSGVEGRKMPRRGVRSPQ